MSYNWQTLRTSAPSAEILNAEPGIYDIKIVAINGIGTRSGVTTLRQTVSTQVTVPPNVTGATITPIDESTGLLSWNATSNVSITVGGAVIVRHQPVMAGASWEASTQIVPNVAGAQSSAIVPLLQGTYLLKFTTSGGIRSAGVSTTAVDLPTPHPRLTVSSIAEDATGFAGTTNGLYFSAERGGLSISGGVLFDALATDSVPTQSLVITVTNPGGGNVFVVDGVNNPVIALVRGGVYTFIQSAASNTTHQIAFKDSGGASYTTGVVTTGTPGTAGAQTVFTVPNNAPADLRYYCVTHGNYMGNTITVTDAGLFDALGTLDSLGGVSTSGEYLFAASVDLGATYDANFTRRLAVLPFNVAALFDDNLGDLDTWGDLDGTDVGDTNVLLYVRSTPDDPAGSPTWGEYRICTNNMLRGRGFEFKAAVFSEQVSQNIVVTQVGAITELQQRIERSAVLPSDAGLDGLALGGDFDALGTLDSLSTFTVTFTDAFYDIPAVNIAPLNMNTGDYFTLSAVTSSTYQVAFFDSGGDLVSRQFTHTSVGHGRRI